MNAKKVFDYMKIYMGYLIENNLPDDSGTVTVQDLVDFVENEIEPESYAYYRSFYQD